MPNTQPIVLQQDQFLLRHVGPQAAVWPDPPISIAAHALLARDDMVARPLPRANIPASPDFVSGSWTGRLNDAGELQLLFPNKESSEGIAWRDRFDPSGHLQFLEVYYNGLLDSVCVIDTTAPDISQVTVHGQDGWFLLKKAYARDWIVTQAPRDVIEHGTQLWIPVTSDNFPAGGLNPQWSNTSSGGGTVTIGPNGGATFAAGTGSSAQIQTAPQPVAPTGVWTASCAIQNMPHELDSGLHRELPDISILLEVNESSGDNYGIALWTGAPITAGPGTNIFAQLYQDGAVVAQSILTPQVAYGLSLESDGEWVWAFVNGQFVGGVRRATAETTSIWTNIRAENASPDIFAPVATCLNALTEVLQPFLMRGADKGDYALPGDASTYPNGGLHARYYNDLDLQNDPNRLLKIGHPSRSQAYGGSTTVPEYANQQDATINEQPIPAGASASGLNWSAFWFGAIWLELGSGDYEFQVNTPGRTALRVWVGRTMFGEQLVDEWEFSAAGTPSSFSFTVSASSLEGNLGYGMGTVARSGWYPIKIQYAADSTTPAPSAIFAPTLYLINSPTGYTDPGGTVIAAGAQTTIVPATSLSPLGCIDQRYQGVSHFDLVQQTLQGFGYQASVEPQQLESGLFPGVLAPRIREGHDTDIVLTPDTGPRQDGEGLLNYSSTTDATDFCASLRGNGAGFQNGNTGQLQAVVYDPATLADSLFDVQGWQDFSDASFAELLQALLNGQLGLRLEPWQLLSADPLGRPRLANTWPLPSTLAQMRWRPGDGLLVRARDISVWDVVPRQLLVFTRNITPLAITGSQANFANRPRNPARTLKQQLYSLIRLQRSNQGQLI